MCKVDDPGTGTLSPEAAAIESRCMALVGRLMELRWSRYAERRRVDGTAIYSLLHELSVVAVSLKKKSRRAEILRRCLQRTRIDARPDVATLTERLAEPGTYEGSHPADPATRSHVLARAMEPDLIQLLHLRNELSRTAGFATYGHLVAHTNGYDLDAVNALMTGMRSVAIPHVRASLGDVTLDDWFAALAAVSDDTRFDAEEEALALARRLGLGDAMRTIRLTVEDQPIAGFDCPVSVPDDVRILLSPQVGSGGLTTVFHELGHAMSHALNAQAGVMTTTNELFDEAMAVTMELIARELRLGPPEAHAALLVERLETARMASSRLFEVAVAQRPGSARDLYVEWYSPIARVDDPASWALDTFRSEDPFHIATYVIGYLVGHATVGFLRSDFDDDDTAWGRWLTSRWYAPGRTRSFFDKIEDLGDFLAAEVARLEAAG
jgi:hypothetical protein